MMAMEGSNSNPMEQAMRNPIVLQRILGILLNEFFGAKKLRLVCKQWNEIILTLPKPMIQLNLDGGDDDKDEDEHGDELNCCDAHSFQIFCSDMEPNLARSIKLSPKICNQDHPKSLTVHAAGSKLIHVCDKFGDLIQSLDLRVGNDLIYKILSKINYCPNLKDIIIYKSDGELLNPNSLPIRPKLSSIYLNVNKDDTITTTHSLCQLLINSAPNLEKLELSSEGYFPDLSKSLNLRTLIIPRGPILKRFRFAEFSQMLEQIAEKLELLKIGCAEATGTEIYWDLGGVDPGAIHQFRMPKMPRLKSFRNNFADTFICGDALEDLCVERCPNLKSLYVAQNCYGNFNIDPLLRRVIENKTQLNVTSLILEGVNDHSVIASLKTSFPHLERLELINRGFFKPKDGLLLELGPSLKACTSLGLSHFGLELDSYPGTLSEFLTCFLDNYSLFKMLKSFWVNEDGEYRSTYFDEDALKETAEGWNLMRQFLFTFVGMKSVEIFPRFKKDVWWEKVYKFIQENNIPVEFDLCEDEDDD